MAKLNLESFNDILINAGIDKKELLEHEIEAAYAYKIQYMEQLVILLNNGDKYSKTLQAINNIDSNLDDMQEQLEKGAQKA